MKPTKFQSLVQDEEEMEKAFSLWLQLALVKRLLFSEMFKISFAK